MGQVFASTGASLTKNVTVPLVGIATECVKTSNEFETSMLKVKALSGATGQDFEALKSKAAEMGETTIFTAKESADAMGYMALAGWKTSDMLAGLPPILNLAAAAGSDLAQTSDIVTDNLSAFGLSAEHAEHFCDVMAATMANSNTTVEMLGESFKYCAPIAHQLGYSVEDTSLALGLMANSGIKASQAGTSLRRGLTSLAAPTDKAKALMDKYGISLTNADGTSKSLREVLEMLRDKFGGLGIEITDANGNVKSYSQLMDEAAKSTNGAAKQQAIQAANTIFGKTAMSGMLAITNASQESWDKLADAIDNSDGATQDMVDTMSEGLDYQITILKSEVSELARRFGDVLKPGVMAAVKVLQVLVKMLVNIPAPVKAIIAAVLAVVAAIGPLMLIIGTLIIKIPEMKVKIKACTEAFKFLGRYLGGNFLGLGSKLITFFTHPISSIGNLINILKGGLVNAFKMVGSAISQVWTFMLANPITFVIAAIALLVGSLVLLYNKCDWFKKMWNEAWTTINKVFQDCAKRVSEKMEELKPQLDKIKENINKISKAFSDFFNSPEFQKFMEGVVNAAVDLIVWALEKLTDFLIIVIDVAGRALDALIKLFEGDWDGAIQEFASIFDDLGKMICDSLMQLVENVKVGLVKLWSNIKGEIEGWPFAETIKKVFETVWIALGQVQQVIEDLFNLIHDVFTGNWSSIPGDLVDLICDLGDLIVTTVGNIFGIIGQAIWDGLCALGQAIWDWLQGQWQEICDYWNNMIESIGQWFEELPARVEEGLNQIGQAIQDGWNSMWSWIGDQWNQMCEGLDTFFFETLPYLLGYGVGKILQFFQDIGHFFTVDIPETLNQLGEDMAQFIDDCVKWWQTLPGRLAEWWNKTIDDANKWKDNMIKKANEAGRQFVEDCINWWKGLPGRIAEWFNNTVEKAQSWKDNMVRKAQEAGQKFVDNVIKWIQGLPGKIQKWFNDILKNAGVFGSGLGKKGSDASNKFGTNLKNGMSKLPSQMASIGKSIVHGLWSGITGAAGWLRDKANEWATSFKNGMKAAFKINSPSKLMRDEVGVYIAEGVTEGFENSWNNFIDNAGQYSKQLVDVFDSNNFDIGQAFPDGSIASSSVVKNVQMSLNIDKFENNREQDIGQLADELAFYVKQRL
jgi:phage tail tape measure protein, TP901 family, core region/phage tail tape measure protein, TP901 family, core region